jgi:hypothetical protein
MEPYVYDVHVEMMHPVRAKPGHLLIVRPGHEERPVLVMERHGSGWRPLRIGPPNFGALIGLEEDQAITLRYPLYASLSQHPALRQA